MPMQSMSQDLKLECYEYECRIKEIEERGIGDLEKTMTHGKFTWDLEKTNKQQQKNNPALLLLLLLL